MYQIEALSKINFSRETNALSLIKIDFSDALIYQELNKSIKERKIPMHQMMREDALKAFEMWDNKVDKVKY